jgi:hypothetical protein
MNDGATGPRWWSLGDLLLAFGGLRYPRSGYVVQLGYLVRESWRVEADCPSCGKRNIVELRGAGITSYGPDGRGGKAPKSTRLASVDRTGYLGLVARGRSVLARGGIDWALEDTPTLLAALAEECGDSLLATCILDLGAVVACAHCHAGFVLSEGLAAL